MMAPFRRLVRFASASFSLTMLLGCDDGGATGAGGGASTSTSSGSTITSTGATSTTTGGGCAPPAACAAPVKDCIGYADNAGQAKFGLRMTWLDLVAPMSLDTPVLKNVIEGGAVPQDMSCNLFGGGTFVWLMEFDTAASTLKTGGAKAVADVTTGFAFADETVGPLHVQPVTIAGVKPDAQGAFSSTTDVDLLLPIYLDQSGTSSILVPMRRVHFTMSTLSADQNCIGHFNASGLDPANFCVPDDTHPAYLQGGGVDAIIVLEDADTVVVTQLNTSLCALVSGDPNTYGEKNAQNVTVCKRTNGVIDFKGDACSSGAGCNDAVKFGANYAAASVKIN